MNEFQAILRAEADRLLALTPTIFSALLVFVLFAGAGWLAGRGLRRVLRRTGRADHYADLAARLLRIVFGVLGLVSALHLLGLTGVATSLLATGGLMAIVLGFAFREIGENLLAGVFLAFSRSFDVGDLIESSGLLGTVRAIDLRQVHIRTGDGCDIFIPSASIYRNPLHNYTRDGLRRTDFTVGIDYGDDPERARGLLLDALRATPGVLEDPAPAVQVAGFSASTVDLQAFLWVNAFGPGPGLGEVRHAAMTAAHRALAAGGFTFSGNVRTGVDLYRAEGLS